MASKRFDIDDDGLRDYHDNGDFLDVAEVAEALGDALRTFVACATNDVEANSVRDAIQMIADKLNIRM